MSVEGKSATINGVVPKQGAETVCLRDAIPEAPVKLEADVMTPHYAGWTPGDPPGDWRSPTPKG